MLFILNGNGVPSVASFVRFPPPSEDVQAPTAPSALSATGSPGSVALSWTASTDNVGVTAYRVYRNGKIVATTPNATPSYTDSGLTASTTYKYRISAIDAAGNESAKSVALSVTTAAANLVLSTATTWNYTDTRVDMGGTGWNGTNYTVNGAPWKSGKPQFGYGDGDETTVLGKGGSTNKTAVFTWYFRTTVNLASVSGPLGIDLIRDDGAIVYVNGTEVFRTNLPTGSVIYTTKATVNVSGADEKTPLHISVPANLLSVGTNTIAVELHNYGANNADASFQPTGGFS
jgi:chitodextrinase